MTIFRLSNLLFFFYTLGLFKLREQKLLRFLLKLFWAKCLRKHSEVFLSTGLFLFHYIFFEIFFSFGKKSAFLSVELANLIIIWSGVPYELFSRKSVVCGSR